MLPLAAAPTLSTAANAGLTGTALAAGYTTTAGTLPAYTAGNATLSGNNGNFVITGAGFTPGSVEPTVTISRDGGADTALASVSGVSSPAFTSTTITFTITYANFLAGQLLIKISAASGAAASEPAQLTVLLKYGEKQFSADVLQKRCIILFPTHHPSIDGCSLHFERLVATAFLGFYLNHHFFLAPLKTLPILLSLRMVQSELHRSNRLMVVFNACSCTHAVHRCQCWPHGHGPGCWLHHHCRHPASLHRWPCLVLRQHWDLHHHGQWVYTGRCERHSDHEQGWWCFLGAHKLWRLQQSSVLIHHNHSHHHVLPWPGGAKCFQDLSRLWCCCV